MIILGIESSCDETACAILSKEGERIQILSNIVSSSANLQAKYGGIIPEQAAREQIKAIIPVIEEALSEARLTSNDIDAIAVTQGPGLIGSLLVGVETAKVLSLVWNKPLIPVNHLIGHFYANWISQENVSSSKYQVVSKKQKSPNTKYLIPNTLPSFPCLGLLVSGGHSDLVLFSDHNKFKYLGGTRDDAAGECFDKCARLLNLPYPGGPQISKLAEGGNAKKYDLPRPLSDSKDLDFSFSGLKTAVSNLVSADSTDFTDPLTLPNLCASIQQAIIDSLIKKTIKAARMTNSEQLIVAGGVAANPLLTKQLREKFPGKVLVPPPYLCTDNAAMIASAAFFQKPVNDPLSLQANPNLSLAY